MNATSTAPNTVEILEAILLQLPPQDLLIGQRVCKAWHDLVKTSQAFQCALFYQYAPHINKKPNAEPILNPLLKRLFDDCYDLYLLCRDRVKTGSCGIESRLRCKHTFHIFVVNWANSNLNFSVLKEWGADISDSSEMSLDEARKLSDCSNIPKVSWQTMLRSDRPVPVYLGSEKYSHTRRFRQSELATALELVKQVAQWQADRMKFMCLSSDYGKARDHPERDWKYRSEREDNDDPSFQPEVITTYDESSDQYHNDSEVEMA